jgi:hypothetical protein
MLLGVGAYFGIGMYYNYSTYGATGYDLIPFVLVCFRPVNVADEDDDSHRDFWREVPYMLRDVAAHLCSGVRSRPTSRGGYVAVWQARWKGTVDRPQLSSLVYQFSASSIS